MRYIYRQDAVDLSSLSNRSHGAIDQSDVLICELLFDLDRPGQVFGEDWLELIRRCRIEYLGNQLSGCTTLIAQKVIYFNKNERRYDDRRRFGQRRRILGPGGLPVTAIRKCAKETPRVCDEGLAHLLGSRNSSDSSPSFKSVETNNPVDGGRRFL